MSLLVKSLITAGAVLPVAAFAVKEAVASKGNAKGEKDYVLILGHALKSNGPTEVLTLRCEKAAEYLREHKNTIAIACGGITGEGQTKSEAEVIKELLTANGIEEERIILEDKSTTTAENFYNAKKLMTESGKTEVALLSSSYHLLRARALAKSCGIEAETIAAPTPKNVKARCFMKEFVAFPFMYMNLKEAKKRG